MITRLKFATPLIAAVLSLAAWPAGAQSTTMDHSKMAMSPTQTLIDGEIRKVDKDAGKMTIKHGEIKHMEMPPMTMVFAAGDKAMLDRVKVGDKVRFMAVQDNGRMVVTEIQVAN